MTPHNFYVYVHLRADDGLPFYVGKGKGKRAWETFSRNVCWRRTEAKHGSLVKILWDGLTESEALRLERLAISDLRAYSPHSMTNITDGGNGNTRAEQTNKNKAAILAFLLVNGGFPSRAVSDEAVLYRLLNSYCTPTSHSYDPQFSRFVRNLGYGARDEAKQTKADNQQKVKDFFSTHGRLPQQYTPDERSLYVCISNNARTSSKTYDPVFAHWCEERGYGAGNRRAAKEEKQRVLKEFWANNGRFPSRHRKEEMCMWTWFNSYCVRTMSAFDPEFRAWCEERGYGRKKT